MKLIISKLIIIVLVEIIYISSDLISYSTIHIWIYNQSVVEINTSEKLLIKITNTFILNLM